jgi:diguanylate cyclase (GGDEF)-like protein
MIISPLFLRKTREQGYSFCYNRIMQDLLADEAFIKHYDALQKSGALKQIQKQQHKIHDLEELLSNAVEIFNQRSPEDLVHFLISSIVDKFIPSHLAFFFHDHDSGETIKSLSFENLRPVPPRVEMRSFKEYRSFFDRYPNSIDFHLFEYSLNEPALTDIFLPLEPAIIVPLIGVEGLFGLIVIGVKMLGEDYSPDEMILLDKLMKFASISLQNSIYYTSAVTDFKTRLYNHSYFMRRLQEETAKVRRHEATFAILAIDVDHFKQFNDKFGHLAGDKVLFSLARVLEASLREEDVLSRFGGEEFFVLLIEASLPTSVQVAERIRNSVQEMRVDYDNKPLNVTVSIGVNHVNRRRIYEESALINQADKALYVSKEDGRNRITVFSPGFLFKAEKAREGK